MPVRLLQVAGVLLRPMAGLASFLGWPLVDVMQGNGPVEIAQNHVIELAHAADLGADVVAGTGADVAGDAGDLGVGRVLIGLELGLHRRVANLAAKRVALGNVIGLVTTQRR